MRSVNHVQQLHKLVHNLPSESTHARLFFRFLANAITAHGVLPQQGDKFRGEPLENVITVRKEACGSRASSIQKAGSGSVGWKG